MNAGLLECRGAPCDSSCGSWVGYFFFPAFIICAVVVLLNLILASLLKNYSNILGRHVLSSLIDHVTTTFENGNSFLNSRALN